VRVLALDHGEKRIGVAVSDDTGSLARPLAIIRHVSREVDCSAVLVLARQQRCDLIIVGESLDEAGKPNAAGRRARNFAESVRRLGAFRVEMWDESLSSQDAAMWRRAGGASRKRRAAAIDSAAAAVMLQSFLDTIRDADQLARGRPD